MMAAKGLENVVMGDSAISFVGGETGELVYRGYPVQELAGHVSYESVVHLLLFGDLPSTDPPEDLRRALALQRTVPPELDRVIEALPRGLPPLEAMRTLVSAMGDGSVTYPPTIEQGYALIGRAPSLLARYVRHSQGAAPVEPREDQSYAENYLYQLTGRVPGPDQLRALESYLILLADHGMNASTLALRVVISTNSDLMSAATAALAALKGPAHGGAPSKVSDMLDAIGRPEEAERWIAAALAKRERLMGFGHRAYKVEDPRAVVLKTIARRVARPDRFALAERVEAVALDALHRERPGQRLYTNVEFYGAVVLEAVGLTRDLFTPTFALGRTAGWVAHALEQSKDNRLIRPDVRYVGPPKGRSRPPAAG
jgi:citrate synthase